MPRIILLLVVLLVLGLGVRSMLRALADGWLAHLSDALDGEQPQLPEQEPDDPAEWLHQRLVDRFGAETAPWALEQVRRVDARLQQGVPAHQRLETVILWIPEVNAFAAPGRRVYLSRRLLERMPCDDALALLIAHEFAHHHLGHTLVREHPPLPGVVSELALDLQLVRRLLSHAENEEECDRHALNLCLAAGYDAHACLKLFDLLEMFALDRGDTEAVFGPDAAIRAALEDEAAWKVALQGWLAERRRGYRPLRERKAVLLEAYRQAVAEAAAADLAAQPRPA